MPQNEEQQQNGNGNATETIASALKSNKELLASAALSAAGVDKCHLMVVANNGPARRFWSQLGWEERIDVRLMSHIASGIATA